MNTNLDAPKIDSKAYVLIACIRMEHKVRLSERNGNACAFTGGKFGGRPSDSHKGIRKLKSLWKATVATYYKKLI